MPPRWSGDCITHFLRKWMQKCSRKVVLTAEPPWTRIKNKNEAKTFAFQTFSTKTLRTSRLRFYYESSDSRPGENGTAGRGGSACPPTSCARALRRGERQRQRSDTRVAGRN